MAIITDEVRYIEAVKEMYPRGKFFEREFISKDSDLSKVANIKGQEIYAFKLKMKELLDESNLLTCSEKTIGDYERIYGLENRADLTLEQRKAIMKNFRGDTLNIASLNTIAELYNAKIKKVVYPHRPARFGESKFGQTRIFDVRVFSVVYIYCSIKDRSDNKNVMPFGKSHAPPVRIYTNNIQLFETAITNMMLANAIIYFKYE